MLLFGSIQIKIDISIRYFGQLELHLQLKQLNRKNKLHK